MNLEIKNSFPRRAFNKKWQFCVGSCHAATLLRADALRQLKRVHDELGIRYVRCHGIFNDDMHTLTSFQDVLDIPGGERFVERSFWHCGVAYDNVLSCGMKPFVELSFMPELLARNKAHGKLLYGSITSMPVDLTVWGEYISAFVQYLIRRYGRQEVESWYFEVWNEPDLQAMFFQGTQEDYFSLYAATANAIKAVCPTLRVGGPATSASKWIAEFVSFCEENRVPVDFISTHQYVGDPFLGISDSENFSLDEVQARMAQTAARFAQAPADTPFVELLRMFSAGERSGLDRDVFAKNAAIVRQQAHGLPVFYTEWNLSASFGGYDNDTRKAAAYDLRTALRTNDLLDGSSIWCYSDIFEELHQFTNEFHGGFGMLTLNGVPKPVFYAMKLMAQAAENRIELDECQFTRVEAAAFENEREIQVLLFRLELDETDDPAEPVSIRVELEHPPRNVTIQRIDEHHCNPLKVWEQIGSPADLTPEQARNLEASSALRMEPLRWQYKDGAVTADEVIGSNDIAFIRIVK